MFTLIITIIGIPLCRVKPSTLDLRSIGRRGITANRVRLLPTAYRLLSTTFRMPAQILDGKALAAQVQVGIRGRVAELMQEDGVVPCLAAVLVGENPASEVYVRNKRVACERAG